MTKVCAENESCDMEISDIDNVFQNESSQFLFGGCCFTAPSCTAWLSFGDPKQPRLSSFRGVFGRGRGNIGIVDAGCFRYV